MAEGEGNHEKLDAHELLFGILRGVYRISHDLIRNGGSDSSAMKAVIELRTASDVMLSLNPNLLSVATRIRHLADSVEELHNSKPQVRGIVSFVGSRVRSLEISRLASEIESEIQSLIDRQLLLTLKSILRALEMKSTPVEEDKLLEKLSVLQERLSRGFDMGFQDSLLKSRIFSELEWVLRNHMLPQRVREKVAVTIKELVLYNKDVFVGSVLPGGSLKALVSMGSCCSLLVLSSLIKAIRSPLVDELVSNCCISDIIGYLTPEELDRAAMALHCIMQIGYFGRKEAIESLINSGLIKKLVNLQRTEQVYNPSDKVGNNKKKNRKTKEPMQPFSGCVSRFVMKLEVGEGMRQREKRAFKVQILNQVKDACDSDAEYVFIVAEVLWCSYP